MLAAVYHFFFILVSVIAPSCIYCLSLFVMLQFGYAAEMYTKMGDTKELVYLYIEAHQWEEVCFSLLIFFLLMKWCAIR